jgi:outer membrane protein OmpA-like peptidoglycan-associated protein
MRASALLGAVLLLTASPSIAQQSETEIPGVTAEVMELRSAGGVMRLAVRLTNGGASPASVGSFAPQRIVLVDAKSKQKHFPLRAERRYVVPNADAGDGEIRITIPPQKSFILWAYFEPLPVGTVVSVELPRMFPFDKVTVTEGPGKILSSTAARTNPDGGTATLVSARRADGVLNVRMRLAADKGAKVVLNSSYFEYRDVALFDPAAKRVYPVMKDSEGTYQALPAPIPNIGGILMNWTNTTLLSLSFPAPPDTVQTVDLILPHFLPLEGVRLEGAGGAAEGGTAASGKSVGLEGALKDLGAKVTETEIRIDLAADVLFDFDQAEIKKEAEPSLQKVATVLNANPSAKVAIEGHTDGKGADAYNQKLSEQRAAAVKQWLVANGRVADANIATRGWGRTKPLAHNTKPDGSDDPEGRAKNRRVEIVVRKTP